MVFWIWIYLLAGVMVGLSLRHQQTNEPAPIWLFVISVLMWPVVVVATFGK